MLRFRPVVQPVVEEADPASALYGAPYDPVTGRFDNPPGSPSRAPDVRAWREFYRRRARDRRPPSVPAGYVLGVEETLAHYEASAGQETVT